MVPSGRGIQRARCLLLASSAAVPSGIRPLPWSTAREWWRESAYLQKPQASAPSSSLRTVFLLVWENLTPYYFLRAVPPLLKLAINYSLRKFPQGHRILKTKARKRSLFAFFSSLSHTCLSSQASSVAKDHGGRLTQAMKGRMKNQHWDKEIRGKNQDNTTECY